MDLYNDDLERGMRNRRAVLGDAWVDQSVAKANGFTADFQSFITDYAWHAVWGRPGLPATTRRIVVLAITCALGRWEEFELHLRAALTGGSGASLGAGDDSATALTPEQVKEVLIQAAVYAGVPAANTGMAIAVKLLRELGHALPPMPANEVAHPGVGRSVFIQAADGTRLHATMRAPRGGATAATRTVVLSHALGADASLWDAVANALAAGAPDGSLAPCRVVCPEHRGHGGSEVGATPLSIAVLADDAARWLDALAEPGSDPQHVAWVGLSLGGMVGQELALRHPGRLAALVLANTTGGYDAQAREGWQQRIATIEAQGIGAVADATMERWFSPAFRAAQAATVARWRRRVVSCSPLGYLAACKAVMQHDTAARLPQLRLPTLVIAGDQDQGTPVAMSEAIAAAVPGAELVVLPGAAHVSAVEQPQAFTAVLRRFLARLPTAPESAPQ